MEQSDIQTEKSIYEEEKQEEEVSFKKQIGQIEKNQEDVSNTFENFYIAKLSTHLEFMERQFLKNIEQQQNIIKQIKKEWAQPLTNKASSRLSLYLSQREEAFIKNLLLTHINSPPLSCDLKTLVELAMDIEKEKYKSQAQEISKVKRSQIYPSIIGCQVPKVLSMRNLPSEKERREKKKMAKQAGQPKIVIAPKMQSIMRTPQSNENIFVTFSPNPVQTEPPKQCQNKLPLKNQVYMMQQSSQLPERLQFLQVSIAKRLNWQDQNIYFGCESAKNSNKNEKQSDKMSLNYSQSNGQKEQANPNDKMIFGQNKTKSIIICSELEEVKSQYTQVNKNILEQQILSPKKYCIKENNVERIGKQSNMFTQKRKDCPQNSEINIPKTVTKAENNFSNRQQLSWQANAVRNYKKKEKPVLYSIRGTGQL